MEGDNEPCSFPIIGVMEITTALLTTGTSVASDVSPIDTFWGPNESAHGSIDGSFVLFFISRISMLLNITIFRKIENETHDKTHEQELVQEVLLSHNFRLLIRLIKHPEVVE